jgi:hypothetical protein
MRWNCPHCEELVTADIDFEATEKAYVRCAKCSGMALIHRSAAIANFVKAQRMDQEARKRIEELEVALRAKHEKAPATAISEHTQEIDIPTVYANPDSAPTTSPAALNTGGMEASSATPPPFAMAPPEFDPIVETYANPPAFLLQKDPETTEAFAWSDESSLPIEEDAPTRARRLAFVSFLSSGTAVWIATTIALASGVYLFTEGRKAVQPAAPEITAEPQKEILPQAEAVSAAASSAARANVKKLVIVRIDRAALRANPNTEANTIQTVGLSTVLTVLDERNGWIQVEGAKIKSADHRAWIAADAITRLPN